MEPSTRKETTNDELRSFFVELKKSETELASYVAEVPAALRRLVKAVYGHDNSQAQTVTAALASIYNGSEARPVQLDELRHLDWSLLKDLVAVMVGIGKITPDSEIRTAFREIGGEDAVEWFHWHTTGGPHRAALRRLMCFISENERSSSARALCDMLRSLAYGGKTADLNALGRIDDSHTRDFVLVLDGLYGRDQGVLFVENIVAEFEKAKVSITA